MLGNDKKYIFLDKLCLLDNNTIILLMSCLLQKPQSHTGGLSGVIKVRWLNSAKKCGLNFFKIRLKIYIF